jgi:penicillin-binding protein-related factor A (putative recombinase)
MANPGKLFEQDFQNSVPDFAYLYRLKDCPGWVSACTCPNGASPRFMPSNDYDYGLYWDGNFWALELKSVAGVSIRHDALRSNQKAGLSRASGFDGLHAGVLVEFRKYGEAWFIPISNWIQHQAESDKKSMNIKEIRADLGFQMHGKKLVSRMRWDVLDLLKQTA